jgi:EAL domain-containing protein (putative c-di-GMP-specific phosphodiesterase class I)
MAAGELELHYQPLWHLGSRREIVGSEALLRWRHPDHGMLRPDAFINLAEQSLAGDELVSWVLAQACEQTRQWRDLGLALTVDVNVAPQQLLAPGYRERFLEQIHTCGLEPSDFVIELTESAWSVDSAEMLQVIADLRALGTKFALDDFGAGYSSLPRLRELDFDMIKVDRSLMVGIPSDRGAVAVLEAIFGVAGVCHARVVVEGGRPRSRWPSSQTTTSPMPRASCSATHSRPVGSLLSWSATWPRARAPASPPPERGVRALAPARGAFPLLASCPRWPSPSRSSLTPARLSAARSTRSRHRPTTRVRSAIARGGPTGCARCAGPTAAARSSPRPANSRVSPQPRWSPSPLMRAGRTWAPPR